MAKVLTLENALSSDRKPIKIDDKSTGLLLAGNNVSVENQPTEDNHIATKKYVDDNAGGSVALNDLTDVTYSSGDLTISSLDKMVADDFVIDSGASIELDSHNGNFVAKKAGTEFSAANSAYAGMVLGYTVLGLDDSAATYNLTTSYAVPGDKWNVAFVAPPSGKVEIEIQVGMDVGSSNAGDLYVGLSTANATSGYSALAAFHESELFDGMSRGALRVIRHSWTLTGLTAGTSYQYWAGFKTSNTMGTPHLQYGGDASGEYPDFIMKATALPTTIAT